MVDYKNCTIDDIIEWCKSNGEVAWLKKEASKKADYKVYPIVKDAEGKRKADKTQPYTIEKRPVSFLQIKKAFYEKFFPEMIPEAKSKETMFDKIMSL